MDPCERQVLWLCLLGFETTQDHLELYQILHFLPMSYITHTIIPVTNCNAKKSNPKWIDLDVHESFHVLGGLLLAM